MLGEFGLMASKFLAMALHVTATVTEIRPLGCWLDGSFKDWDSDQRVGDRVQSKETLMITRLVCMCVWLFVHERTHRASTTAHPCKVCRMATDHLKEL